MTTETVPQTLDLVKHAELALNVLTRAVVPQQFYAVWQCMNLHTNPAYFAWPNWMTAHWLEALPGLRAMTDDDRDLAVEQAMMNSLLERIGPDGLLYHPPASPDIPPGTAYPANCARMILAMDAWHERDGDPAWIDRIRAMATGLAGVAISRNHCAYYPPESGWAGGTWSFTQRGAGRTEFYPYSPPDEPSRDQQGHEGAVKLDNALPIRGLVRACVLTGDEALLEAARRVAAFCLLPGMWEQEPGWGISGHEHGLFAGHFHGNMAALRGLLELAAATGDPSLKGFVREGYEHARRAGIARIGWFPAWMAPERFGRPPDLGSVCDTCSVADMLALAIGMSDAGIGDYWDEADAIVRNQLVEQQITDADRLAAIREKVEATQPIQNVNDVLGATDDVVERTLGGFSMAGPASLNPVAAWGCCTGSGSLALNEAWQSIVRYADGRATVNLLLNRASPWVDVASLLPYEGRVRITPKSARKLAVRIPGWASIGQAAASLAGQNITPARAGRYLVIDGLEEGRAVEIAFPLGERSESCTVNGRRWQFLFRGSTVIDVQPRDDDPAGYPIYRRADVRAASPVEQGDEETMNDER